MPQFSDKSKNRLATCHVALQRLFNAVIDRRDCTILCGRRSRAEQNRLYNMRPRRTHVRWPHSKHNVLDPADLSEAVDVAPWVPGTGVPWPQRGHRHYIKHLALWYNFAGYVQALAEDLFVPIRWGGDWDGDHIYTDQTFDDLVHFELIVRGENK